MRQPSLTSPKLVGTWSRNDDVAKRGSVPQTDTLKSVMLSSLLGPRDLRTPCQLMNKKEKKPLFTLPCLRIESGTAVVRRGLAAQAS